MTGPEDSPTRGRGPGTHWPAAAQAAVGCLPAHHPNCQATMTNGSFRTLSSSRSDRTGASQYKNRPRKFPGSFEAVLGSLEVLFWASWSSFMLSEPSGILVCVPPGPPNEIFWIPPLPRWSFWVTVLVIFVRNFAKSRNAKVKLSLQSQPTWAGLGPPFCIKSASQMMHCNYTSFQECYKWAPPL